VIVFILQEVAVRNVLEADPRLLKQI